MDRSWLLASATGGGGPPHLAGVLLDRERPILAVAAFGYGDGSSDTTTVTLVDDAAAGVVAVDFVDRDGERRARAFLNIDGAGVLLRLVAVFDTVDHATRASTHHVFVLSSTRRPDAAAPPPAPLLLALPPVPPIQVDYIVIDIPDESDHGSNAGDDVPPLGAEDQLAAGGGHNIADEHSSQDGDDEDDLPPFVADDQFAVGGGANMADPNNPHAELMDHVQGILNLLLPRQAVMDLSPHQWSRMRQLFIQIHENIPEAYQVEMENLMAERRLQRLRRRRKLMLRSFLWNIGVSFTSHLALYLLSCHFSETEKPNEFASPPTSLHDQSASPPMPSSDAKESMLLISWGIQKVLSPTLLVFLIWLVKACVIDKEVQLMAYSNNSVMNFFVNSLSKIFFFAVKEFPLMRNTSLIAHACSFIIDFAGALLLLIKQGFWDQDVADA